MKGHTQLEQIRLAKIDQLRKQGIEPFPNKAARTHTTAEVIALFKKNETDEINTPLISTLTGRLKSVRDMGKITFAHIEDGSGKIQLFLRANDIGLEQVKSFNYIFDLGDFLEVSGEIFRTKTGEITLKVKSFRILAKAITPLPAEKDELVDGEVVRHALLTDPETRYRQRYADLAVNPDVRNIFINRAKLLGALRSFMNDHGFLEVETPILQPIYGGAAAQPFITHHNQLKQDLFLRISFELYLKRLLVGGLERVYEIGRDFRNEGVSFKHNPEFTQLEFYWAYADYMDVMELTESMVSYAAEKVLGKLELPYQEHIINLEPPWKRIELRQAILEKVGVDIDEYLTTESLSLQLKSKGMDVNPKSTRGKIIDNLISQFVEPYLIQPTFLYNYPRDISPLAKSIPGNPAIVERFEGFVAGMELCNAFTELNDPLDQEARFIEMGHDYEADDEEKHPMDEDYLRAMKYGMPPNGGFGMGIDRLAMLFSNCHSIREVILFPHLREKE